MNHQSAVTIVGGGAAGLTAALFLARAGVSVVVVDQDRSILKRAELNNLPGSKGLEGRELLTQLRSELDGHGVPTIAAKVEDVAPTADGFTIAVAGGDSIASEYVVITTGQGTLTLPSLALDTTDARQPFVKVNVVTDRWGATSVPGVWAAGVVAGWPSQAVVCAGSGANVAIEIVSRINDEFWVDHDDSRAPAESA
jgi:thioredoxin reductase (NADPH)